MSPLAIAVTVAVSATTTMGVHVVRLWLYRPPRPVDPETLRRAMQGAVRTMQGK